MMMGERGAELVVSTPTTHVTDWVSLFKSYCVPMYRIVTAQNTSCGATA